MRYGKARGDRGRLVFADNVVVLSMGIVGDRVETNNET